MWGGGKRYTVTCKVNRNNLPMARGNIYLCTEKTFVGKLELSN